MIDPKLLNTKQAAEYLSVSVSYLQKDRQDKKSVPFIRLASNIVRYNKDELDEYIKKLSL